MRDTSKETINTNLTTSAVAEAKEMSAAAGLIYVSDQDPGITRVRRGKGFRYLRPDGKPIHNTAELERIAKLAIPPAYTQVWICTNARGHIQATGRDARGRKQYRYHADWRATRDGAKFDRLSEFGLALPKLRRQLKQDLGLPGLPRDKVLAVIITLLDKTRVRIGNSEYARSNKSFGLTTLRNRHIKFLRQGRALLKFRGKGGVLHEVKIDDKRLANIMQKCQELPGQQLFQFVDDEGQTHSIDSTMVNEYLHRVMGENFTAKDFRTWNATTRAIELLCSTAHPKRRTALADKACILEVVRQVARELRNTPTVCRKSYINPVVFTSWQDGSLHRCLRANAQRSNNREKLSLFLLKKFAR